ncbi:MAG: hypothetical protein FWE84_01235 [Firmicutes bacterium]|nr:hypothetical protein [Bacillota bacterium]
MNFCTVIKSDVLDICRRLKEIDRGYFVVRNHKKGRFEVHNRQQRGGSFCLALPYPRLDCRTLDLVRRTRYERAGHFLAELEDENRQIQRAMIDLAAKNAEKKVEDILSNAQCSMRNAQGKTNF